MFDNGFASVAASGFAAGAAAGVHQSNVANAAAAVPTNTAPVGLFGKSGFAPTNISDSSSSSGHMPFGFRAAPSVASGTSPFGATNSTNASAASSFSGFAPKTNFAGFGAAPPAATTPAMTAGFGFPVQVQSATGTSFGQPQGSVTGSTATATVAATAAGGGAQSFLYTPVDQLTVEEKTQFEASRFTLGHVPLKPPPQVYI